MDELIQKLLSMEKAIKHGQHVLALEIGLDIMENHADQLDPEAMMMILDVCGVTNKGWVPFAGPQTAAVLCTADELFYGGAAGGGKSDLLIGAALTQHKHSIIYRRQATQLVGILQRMSQVIGDRKGYNGQDKIWKHDDRLIEFGAVNDLGDEEKYQGRPHDLKGFDEITHFIEIQYIFLNGWKRSNDPKQVKRTIATGNPPSRPEGLWVKKYWGPWLDRKNHLYNKVEPGELAYYFRDADSKMIYLREPEPQIDEDGEEVIPRSITFIPSKVEDNPAYMATGYKQQLQSMPEPLRSQLLKGDFEAMSDDDPYQVIPTKWVQAAMDRWKDRSDAKSKGEMTGMGVDPARGGKDTTTIAVRHDLWFPELQIYPGGGTPDGNTVVSLIVVHRKDDAPVMVDVIGIGSSVVDTGNNQGLHIVPWNNAEKATGMIKGLRFVNKRSWVYWNFRELLDPANDTGIELYPDDDLLAELTAHTFEMRAGGIFVLGKDAVKELIGRSPDRADATVICSVQVQKRNQNRSQFHGVPTDNHDDIEDYDPFA